MLAFEKTAKIFAATAMLGVGSFLSACTNHSSQSASSPIARIEATQAPAARREYKVVAVLYMNGSDSSNAHTLRGFVLTSDAAVFTCAMIASQGVYFQGPRELVDASLSLGASRLKEVTSSNVADATPGVFSDRLVGIQDDVHAFVAAPATSPPALPASVDVSGGKGYVYFAIPGFPNGAGLLEEVYNTDFRGDSVYPRRYCRSWDELVALFGDSVGERVTVITRTRAEMDAPGASGWSFVEEDVPALIREGRRLGARTR